MVAGLVWCGGERSPLVVILTTCLLCLTALLDVLQEEL